MNRAKPHACYKRLETDSEFLARLDAAGANIRGRVTTEELDTLGWDQRRMQRRVVEDVA